MTKDDIEHLAQVCESLKAQCVAQAGFSISNDFDSFLGRMLWAIHASPDNPEFDESRFRAVANGNSDLEGGMKVFKD